MQPLFLKIDTEHKSSSNIFRELDASLAFCVCGLFCSAAVAQPVGWLHGILQARPCLSLHAALCQMVGFLLRVSKQLASLLYNSIIQVASDVSQAWLKKRFWSMWLGFQCKKGSFQEKAFWNRSSNVHKWEEHGLKWLLTFWIKIWSCSCFVVSSCFKMLQEVIDFCQSNLEARLMQSRKRL